MTLLERLLGKKLPEGVISPRRHAGAISRWCRALFYLALGAANLWVAFTMSQAAWVNFKSFVVIPLVFVFTFGLSSGSCAASQLDRRIRVSTRVERLRAALEQSLHPTLLEIRDDSAQHAGHAGAREGGHFHVTIVAAAFTGRLAGAAPSDGLCCRR